MSSSSSSKQSDGSRRSTGTSPRLEMLSAGTSEVDNLYSPGYSGASSQHLTPVLRRGRSTAQEKKQEVEITDDFGEGVEGMSTSSSGRSKPSQKLSPVLRPTRRGPTREEKRNRSDVTIVSEATGSDFHSEQEDNEQGSEAEEEDIFEALQKKETNVKELCATWMNKFLVDYVGALQKLVQLLIHSTGCKGVLTSDVMDKTATNILADFMEEFDDDENGYPLIRPGKRWILFSTNFRVFFSEWARNMGRKLFEEENSSFIESFNTILLAMASHKVRNYRHTATVAVIEIMNSVVKHRLRIFVNLEDKQRQLESEKRKQLREGFNSRISSLASVTAALQTDVNEFKTLFDFYYKSVFCYRFRDTCDEIRLLCISALLSWMKIYPKEYVQDHYLRVIDVSLTDKDDQVRRTCLEHLTALYMNDELVSNLERFTTKCKDRLVALTVNSNVDISEKAIRTVVAISKSYSVLTDFDLEIIYKMIYAADRGCAIAAAEFLSDRLFANHSANTFDSPKKTASGKKRRPNTAVILDLVDFFIESELPSHAPYLVDSLMDIQPILKDWPTMTELLLEEPGPEEVPLRSEQEMALIKIMTCSLEQSAGGIHPTGREPKTKTGAKFMSQLKSNQIYVTKHFMVALPQLITKYQTDDEKLGCLFTIPFYFDMTLLANRQHRSLESILQKMKECVVRQSSPEVIEATARVFELLCLDETLSSTMTEVSLGQVLETLPANLVRSLRTFQDFVQTGVNNSLAVENVCSDLQKIALYIKYFDLNPFLVWNPVFEILEMEFPEGLQQYFPPKKSYASEMILYAQAINDAISACYFSLIWDLKVIKDRPDESGEGAAGARSILQLKIRTRKFLASLKSLMSLGSEQEVIKEHAFTAICDVLAMFSERSYESGNRDSSQLVIKADENCANLLIQFLVDTVFQADNNLADEIAARNLQNVTLVCKLLILEIIKPVDAANVFKYYLEFCDVFGDLFKTTLNSVKKSDEIVFSSLIIESLRILYEDLQSSEEDLLPVYNLARRFSLLFGVGTSKNQTALTDLLQKGIDFVAHRYEDEQPNPPTNLSFLDVLLDFSGKLTLPNKESTLRFLNQRFDVNITPSKFSTWLPLHDFRKSLGYCADGSPSGQNTGDAGTRGHSARHRHSAGVTLRSSRKRLLLGDE